MIPNMTSQEIQLISRFSQLTPEGKREIDDYLRFVLLKQYKKELCSQVLNNSLLHNGFLQAVWMCEREDTSIEDIVAKVRQLKFVFYQSLERTYCRYSEVLGELMVEDILRDWGSIGFDSVLEAANTGNKELMKQELENMLQDYGRLAKKEDKRKIVAV
ncbi:MAG: hypothetical protein ACM3MK_13490 [Chitinophagales bacterium]